MPAGDLVASSSDLVLRVGSGLAYFPPTDKPFPALANPNRPVSYYPYMVSVGNHEAAYNFSHYRYRFNMPEPRDLPPKCCPYSKNAFYSWNYGLVLSLFPFAASLL